ncbi:MAG: glycosyltransferase [Parcubacteria group bacterium]
MTEPLISVVIPTFNRAKHLGTTIEHIMNQSIPREQYEVIVVDNRSTDDTAAVLKQLAKNYRTLHYAYQRRPGAAPTRNEGIRLARAPLILFIDDDILAAKQLIQEHLKGHAQSSCSVLGHIDVNWEQSNERFLRYLKESEDQNTFKYLDPSNASYLYFYTGNVSCRAEVLRGVGGFDEGFTVYGVEDIDLGYRLEMRGERMIYCKNAQALHDYRPTYNDFLRKRFNNGRSLAYFLAKFPNLRAQFSFGKHPLLMIGLPRYAMAWLKPLMNRATTKSLTPLQYYWFTKALRWQLYKGYRAYRTYWNRSGLELMPTKSALLGNVV